MRGRRASTVPIPPEPRGPPTPFPPRRRLGNQPVIYDKERTQAADRRVHEAPRRLLGVPEPREHFASTAFIQTDRHQLRVPADLDGIRLSLEPRRRGAGRLEKKMMGDLAGQTDAAQEIDGRRGQTKRGNELFGPAEGALRTPVLRDRLFVQALDPSRLTRVALGGVGVEDVDFGGAALAQALALLGRERAFHRAQGVEKNVRVAAAPLGRRAAG